MKVLQAEIDIDAEPERVWQILTDFESLPAWNPFIRSLEGEAREGAGLTVVLKPPKGMGMTFRPTVLKAERPREFRWLGKLLLPGLFDGEHFFLIQRLGNGRSHFVQGEIFRGLLVPLIGLFGVYDNTLLGFEAMNQALKQRAQAPA